MEYKNLNSSSDEEETTVEEGKKLRDFCTKRNL
jgi:hypothetical protein